MLYLIPFKSLLPFVVKKEKKKKKKESLLPFKITHLCSIYFMP